MDLTEILSNPLFVPLLVAVITIAFNVVFLFLLKKWQYRTEYIIRNVENTYIPLVAEIHDKLELFDRFLETPYLDWRMLIHFEELENVKKSGLFEFIRSHDKKLYEKLDLFYRQIYPRFRELFEFHQETRKTIGSDWTDYITNVITDEKAKKHSSAFVSELFQKGLYALLLKGRTEEISKIWNETLFSITQTYRLYSPYIKVDENKIKMFHGGKFPTFNVSEDNLKELVELSHPKIQKLLDLYNQIKASLEHEVVKGLIPMMQKYITNPLSR